MILSAKSRGLVVVYAIDFPLCLRNLFGKLFYQFLFQALRHFLPLIFFMAMMCISQVCLGRGVCILFQKGTSAYRSYFDGMEPKKLHMRKLTAERCVGFCGHPFIHERKKHEGSCCVCAKGSRANCMPCC